MFILPQTLDKKTKKNALSLFKPHTVTHEIVSLLVGGPDGLAKECKQQAEQLWSLSSLTLPHPLVRVFLAEQLYRAWSVTQGHPYHRE